MSERESDLSASKPIRLKLVCKHLDATRKPCNTPVLELHVAGTGVFRVTCPVCKRESEFCWGAAGVERRG